MTFRLDENSELRFANKALKSSLSRTCTNPDGGNQKEAKKVVTVLGEKSSAIKVKQLDAESFNLVASGYDNSNTQFNSLYTKWKRFTRKKVSLAAWKPYPSAGVTRLQNEMRKMTSRVRDISRAEMDGLLFRTAANQEKFLIDNACVVNQYKLVILLSYV